jgi:hypothetical protein
VRGLTSFSTSRVEGASMRGASESYRSLKVTSVDRDAMLALILGHVFWFVVVLSVVAVFGLAWSGVHATVVVHRVVGFL